MEESLDASYALLRDVNARNRELQARLHSSLPLLWTNNAIVMTSAEPRRRRGGRLLAEQSAHGEADQMLLALEGQASLQVSRRYKRRVEWEVARRIARVDRELQQYPPAQRFWNRKRKEAAVPAPRPSSSYRQRVNGMERTEVQGGVRSGLGVLEGVTVEREAGMRATVERVRSTSRDKAQPEKAWVKPRILTQKAVKRVETSPLLDGVEDVEDKENTKPNAMIRAKAAPLSQNFSPSKMSTSKLQDDVPATKDVTEDKNPGESANRLESDFAATSGQPEEVKSCSPRHARSSSMDEVLKKEKDVAVRVRQDTDADDASVVEEESPRRTKTPVQERASSSIGRQVLSEFRTMPSVASFGAQPILSAGGMGKPGDLRLNADVLRRLFSDLDTDKDGHVNRIETCMALHRLRISVPTTKIISFFRHIHSSDGKGARSRSTQHMPMKEVINYKEFVAFVTAAYDQQQQQKTQRSRTPTRRKIWKEDHVRSPLSVPSTSLPVFARPTSSPSAKTYVRVSPPLIRQQEIRVYEMDGAGSEQEGAALEERVIKEIPDFLVSRILADTPRAASVETKKTAASIVRKSLESLVGKDAVDDKIVNEITHELLRERLRNLGTKSQEGAEDVTGLRKAAAYYNEQMLSGDEETGPVAEDSSSEDLVNWVDILTEEQVSGLVQQIWKDRQDSLRHAPLETVIIEELTEVPEDQIARWIDEATDTNEHFGTIILSDKAVQASHADNQEKFVPKEEIAAAASEKEHGDVEVLTPALPAIPESVNPLQTHLARALGISLRAPEHGNGSHELFSPVTSIGILQHLRQQRRMHQRNLHGQQAHSLVDEPVKLSPEPSAQSRVETNDTHNDLLDKGGMFSSDEECDSASSQSVEHDAQLSNQTEKRNPVPAPATEFVSLTQKMLGVDDSASNESSLELVSMSASSSGFSSTSDHQRMYGMQREIERHQLHGRSMRRRRPQRRRRRLSISGSGSSVPDSICSAELSEGELSREEALDLSDGEIFGECKRKYIRHKNTTLSVMKSTSDSEIHLSSVESGELPALMKAHAAYRHQVLAQSTSSSVESGEVEDGAISS